ncbi:MAG: hypothetical protein CME29_00035 [Gemmatimonadetes bacterium]|nr:hypothetical protein [Gemmatimonadota bacterium]|tara:strand:+ start:133514 stop:134161 length:648 start_codon:yes stop_codon:yes gene_type:complete
MTMTQTDTPRYRDRTTSNHRIPTIFFALLLLGNIACADANTGLNGNQETPGGSFNLGSTASASDIAAWDLDMDPSGSGAPIGSGSVSEGKQTYDLKCASCHGVDGGGTSLGDQLVGREPLEGFPFGQVRGQYRRTVGNYWPYATTLFDYIIRAMPMNAPGSLTVDEVYAASAYILYMNDIIDENAVMDTESLPKVVMPARDRFVMDNRTGGPEIR